MALTREQIADLIAKKTLEHFKNPHDSINPYQKEISGGNININRDPTNPLVVYRYDLKANIEDYVNILIGNVPENELSNINTVALFEEFSSSYLIPPSNIGQFVEFEPSQSVIDGGLASEILDSSIYELLPPQTNRQQDINNFFTTFFSLTDDPPLFEESPIGSGNYISSSDWDDIAEVPNSPSASIVRLDSDAVDSANNEQTLEYLRDLLNYYLIDVDSMTTGDDLLDERPDYENVSDGYLTFRGLNQSILIRQEDGQNINFATDSGDGSPNYLNDGFTITMWVKFLNKVNSGTLFNFGNPFRQIDPHGFRLETFILKNGDVTGAPAGMFQDTDYERFVRLVLLESGDFMRDSSIVRSGNSSDWQAGIETIDYMISQDDSSLYNYTHIPVDLTEWYFIVANYNVDISEDTSYGIYDDIPDFWKWNITAGGEYTSNSGLGARCKVEIISKSDLLRARGYKTE